MFRVFKNSPSRDCMHIKMSIFIFMAALLVTSFVLNNITISTAYAKAKDKPNKVLSDSNRKHKSITHDALPYHGVNMKGYNTGLPQSREGFKNPYPWGNWLLFDSFRREIPASFFCLRGCPDGCCHGADPSPDRRTHRA